MKSEKILLEFWEDRFPGKGAAVLGVLRPFYEWNGRLNTAVSDLEPRVRRVLGTKVRPCTLAEAEAVGNSCKRDGEGFMHMSNRLERKYGKFPFSTELFEESRLDLTLHTELFTQALGLEYWDSLYFSLFDTLWMACKLTLMSEVQKLEELQGFLNLWLEGNFPDFFDDNDALIVMVAA